MNSVTIKTASNFDRFAFATFRFFRCAQQHSSVANCHLKLLLIQRSNGLENFAFCCNSTRASYFGCARVCSLLSNSESSTCMHSLWNVHNLFRVLAEKSDIVCEQWPPNSRRKLASSSRLLHSWSQFLLILVLGSLTTLISTPTVVWPLLQFVN
jgi:hypothetical protein